MKKFFYPRSLVSGFTLIELIVSITILSLISSVTVFTLRASRSKEELRIAAQVLAGDIRNIQARALAGGNVLTCENAQGAKQVCEDEKIQKTMCVGSCVASPPSHFGILFTAHQSTYSLFADVMDDDWHYSGFNEQLIVRSLNPQAGSNVIIDHLQTTFVIEQTATIAVSRQNGQMRIDACGGALSPCSPSEPQTLTIVLRNVVSNETVTLDINAVTGRVSIE